MPASIHSPIALAGATWDATKGWFSKWVAFVIALILSKLVLVAIFLVAVAQVSAPIDADLASVSDPIAGIVLMVIAAFAPYMTYKFLNFAGLDVYHAMSTEQEAKSALNRPVPVPNSPMADPVKKILEPSSNGGNGKAPQGGGTPTTPPGGGGPGPASMPGGSSGGAGSTAGASSKTGTAGAGAGAAAGAATAGVSVAAAAVSAAAKAGPKIGSSVGQAADGHTQSAGNPGTPSASPPPPAAPRPGTPRTTPGPATPAAG